MIGITQDQDLAMILHDVDAQSIAEIVERIRERLEAYSRQDSEGQGIKIGWACFPSHGVMAEDLFDAAQEGQDPLDKPYR